MRPVTATNLCESGIARMSISIQGRDSRCCGIVPVRRPRIASVGIAGPDVMRDVRVAVHVVPPRVDEHAVVRDARAAIRVSRGS